MKILKCAFLLALVCLTVPALAQQSRNTKKEDDKSFKERLWYGAGLNLGFGSFNGQSAFGVGISPMVGYKVLPFLSVGPRVSVNYSAQKVVGYKAFNLVDTEIGAFVRGHLFRGFFLQGEMGLGWDQNLYQNTSGEIFRLTERRTNQYFGLGYNFAGGRGGAGQEIAVMYNFALANDVNSNRLPLDYRFAFTWGF